jgi:hypothetical protein
MSDDLVAFLRARLDEDEADALACPLRDWSYGLIEPGILGPDNNWRASRLMADDGPSSRAILAYGTREHDPDGVAVRHAARHDPARVRRAVLGARDLVIILEALATTNPRVSALTLRLMARQYDRHPDFRAEWRP